MDALTKSVRAEAIPSKKAREIAIFLWKNLYCEYGTPGNCVVQDRGDELNAKIVKELHDFFGCEIRLTNAGNKEANGQAERYFRTFKDRLAASQAEYKDELLPRDWERTLLPAIVFGMNSCRSSAHKKVPLELSLGRSLYTPFDIEKMNSNISDGKKVYKSFVLQVFFSFHSYTDRSRTRMFIDFVLGWLR